MQLQGISGRRYPDGKSNVYKTFMHYMEVNGFRRKQSKEVLPCFEKEYNKDGISYMDVYIAIEL